MQHARQRPQKRRLAEARNALQQHMPSGEQADQYTIDDILLADNDLSNFLPDAVELANGLGGRELNGHGFLSTL